MCFCEFVSSVWLRQLAWLRRWSLTYTSLRLSDKFHPGWKNCRLSHLQVVCWCDAAVSLSAPGGFVAVSCVLCVTSILADWFGGWICLAGNFSSTSVTVTLSLGASFRGWLWPRFPTPRAGTLSVSTPIAFYGLLVCLSMSCNIRDAFLLLCEVFDSLIQQPFARRPFRDYLDCC